MQTAPFRGRTYKGVSEALTAYAQRHSLSVTDALCHALGALGYAEAASLRGQLAYVPGSASQERFFYWGVITRHIGLKINLAKVGKGIKDEMVELAPKLVLETAAAAFNAYRQANRTSEAVTLAKAVYVLLLLEVGDLAVQDKDGTRVVRFDFSTFRNT